MLIDKIHSFNDTIFQKTHKCNDIESFGFKRRRYTRRNIRLVSIVNEAFPFLFREIQTLFFYSFEPRNDIITTDWSTNRRDIEYRPR